MRRMLLIILLSIACSQSLCAATAEISIDPTQTTLDNTVKVMIRVYHDSDQEPDVGSISQQLAAPTLQGTRPFSVEDTQVTRTPDGTTMVFTLEPWETGTHVLIAGPLNLYRDNDTSEILWPSPVTVEISPITDVAVEPPPIQVLPLAGGPQLLADPDSGSAVTEQRSASREANRNLEAFASRTLPWRTLTVLLLMVVATYFLRSHITEFLLRLFGLKDIKAEPPRLIALRALDRLEKYQLDDDRQIGIFYIKLTNIVRRYLEDEYDLHAPEYTTEEFLEESRKEFSENTQSLLAGLLGFGDLVKFAQEDATPERCKEALADARTFVEEG